MCDDFVLEIMQYWLCEKSNVISWLFEFFKFKFTRSLDHYDVVSQ